MVNRYKKTYSMESGTVTYIRSTTKKGKKGRLYRAWSPSGKSIGRIFVPNSGRKKR